MTAFIQRAPMTAPLRTGDEINVKQDGVDYGWFRVTKVAPTKIDLKQLTAREAAEAARKLAEVALETKAGQ